MEGGSGTKSRRNRSSAKEPVLRDRPSVGDRPVPPAGPSRPVFRGGTGFLRRTGRSFETGSYTEGRSFEISLPRRNRSFETGLPEGRSFKTGGLQKAGLPEKRRNRPSAEDRLVPPQKAGSSRPGYRNELWRVRSLQC